MTRASFWVLLKRVCTPAQFVPAIDSAASTAYCPFSIGSTTVHGHKEAVQAEDQGLF